jgi:hypothetical protein
MASTSKAKGRVCCRSGAQKLALGLPNARVIEEAMGPTCTCDECRSGGNCGYVPHDLQEEEEDESDSSQTQNISAGKQTYY